MNMISFFWKSFYDAKAYSFALKEWKFKTLGYFLLVSLTASVCSDFVAIPAFTGFIDREAGHISSQIPECKIGANGFEFPQKDPVYIKLSNGKNFIAFTSSFIPPNEMEGLAIAFERDWISFKADANSEKRMPYSEIWESYSALYPGEDSLQINPQTAAKFLEYLKDAAICALPVLNFIIAIISSSIMVFSILIPTHLLAMRMMKNPRIFDSLKIGLIASTPAILLSSAGQIFGMSSFATIVFAMLSFAIVWKMVRQIAMLQIIEGGEK